MICYKLNIWVLRGAVNRERSLAKMKIKWQKKKIALGVGIVSDANKPRLVSSSAQAQLHQAPVNGLENDLIYQVTCTYNILNGCAARVRETREQGMMGRRERTPNANPLYPIHPSMFAYIRFSPLNDPQDAVPVSRDWSTNETSIVHFLWPYNGKKKTAMVCSFLFLYKYTLLIGGHVSPQRRKKMFSGCRIPWS